MVDLIRSRYNIISPLKAVDPGATGIITVATIPPLEFWEIYMAYAFKSSGGGTLTISNFLLQDPSGTDPLNVRRPTAAASQIYSWESNPLPVAPTWIIQLYVPAYTAGDEMSIDMLIKRTDLRDQYEHDALPIRLAQ